MLHGARAGRPWSAPGTPGAARLWHHRAVASPPRGKATRAPKVARLEEELAALARVRHSADPAELLAGLQAAIASRSSFVVAAAAEIVRDRLLGEPLPALAASFDRFLEDAVARDPGCKAKYAIAEALVATAYPDPGPFLRGIRHRQPEPVWAVPPTVDTAAGLRGACAIGLANLGHPEALDELAALLADPEPAARANAARALAATGSEAALPLLRFKVLSGDPAAEVLTESLGALLALAPARSLPFVASLLEPPPGDRLEDRGEARAESAALALGQSRIAEALLPLQRFCEAQLASRRRVALLSIGLLRSAAGTEYLLEQLEQAPVAAAAFAVASLAISRHDPALRRRVEQAVERRALPLLDEAFARAFSRP